MKIDVVSKNMNILEAFTSRTRVKIIEMLDKKPMNIKDIASELNISSAIITKHIQKLEETGIVKSDSIAGTRGMQKICSLDMDQAILQFRSHSKENNFYYHTIHVGYYTDYNVKPACGLASRTKIIGNLDEPRYFSDHEHTNAVILWFGSGWIEYKIPNYLLSSQKIKSIEISLEICSNFPGYNEDWPSDINFSLNDIEIGAWTSPGDFGETKGIYTPQWAKCVNWTQHGLLKTLLVNEEGSYLDGIRFSGISIDKINLSYGSDIRFRLSNLETATNKGGITIFGKGFGNYDQDINIIIGF